MLCFVLAPSAGAETAAARPIQLLREIVGHPKFSESFEDYNRDAGLSPEKIRASFDRINLITASLPLFSREDAQVFGELIGAPNLSAALTSRDVPTLVRDLCVFFNDSRSEESAISALRNRYRHFLVELDRYVDPADGVPLLDQFLRTAKIVEHFGPTARSASLRLQGEAQRLLLHKQIAARVASAAKATAEDIDELDLHGLRCFIEAHEIFYPVTPHPPGTTLGPRHAAGALHQAFEEALPHRAKDLHIGYDGDGIRVELETPEEDATLARFYSRDREALVANHLRIFVDDEILSRYFGIDLGTLREFLNAALSRVGFQMLSSQPRDSSDILVHAESVPPEAAVKPRAG